MSREQAAAGLKDVNQRIWDHNHIDKPIIEALPPNDPRRLDFHRDTHDLNAEKERYLDVLPQQHPPASVTGPGGANLPGVTPGTLSEIPSNTGQGWVYPVARGYPGVDPRVVSMRVMEPTNLYPKGYIVYMNNIGQTVNHFTGQTVAGFSDPFAHIPIP